MKRPEDSLGTYSSTLTPTIFCLSKLKVFFLKPNTYKLLVEKPLSS